MLPEGPESKFVNGLNLELQENWWFLHILATFYRLQFLSNIQSYDKFSGYCVFSGRIRSPKTFAETLIPPVSYLKFGMILLDPELWLP